MKMPIFGIRGHGLILLVLLSVLLMLAQVACSSDFSETTPSPSPAHTTTSGTSSSGTSVLSGKPEPFFPIHNSSREGYSYGLGGLITGVTIEKEVKNRGGAGEVFVTVDAGSQDLSGSKVFYMDKDESVVIQAHFRVFESFFSRTFKWETRAAMPGDVSQGEIEVIRSNMKMVGQVNIGTVVDISVSGDFAYALVSQPRPYSPTGTISDFSLKIVDISNPQKPRMVGGYDFNPAMSSGVSEYGVCAIGQYVYVAIGHWEVNEDNGLHIIDVSNPSSPFRAGLYRTEGGSSDVDVAGSYAYVVTNQVRRKINAYTDSYTGVRSLLVLDVSVPSNPEEVGRYEWKTSEVLETVALKDNRAYVVEALATLHVIDVGNPYSLREVGKYSFSVMKSPGAQSVALAGNYAYMVGQAFELAVLDVSNPSISTLIGRGDQVGKDVTVAGGYAYLAAQGLLAVDISNHSSPKLVGRTGLGVGGSCVTVSRNYVYLGGSYGLQVIDSRPVRELIDDSR